MHTWGRGSAGWLCCADVPAVHRARVALSSAQFTTSAVASRCDGCIRPASDDSCVGAAAATHLVVHHLTSFLPIRVPIRGPTMQGMQR